MTAHLFKRIFLEAGAEDYEMTRRILARLPRVPVETIPGRDALKPRKGERAAWIAGAKDTLLLAVQKGPFLRPCPGTRDYICCGYQVLQVGLNCPLDCTYCVLQGYLNIPAVTVFVNVEDLLTELEASFREDSAKVWRLGTGEFGDGLALDALTGLNARLIPFFAGRPRAALEIKTKWHLVEPLLPFGPNPQVIFSWSLNPPEIVRAEERGAPALAARLKAAARAAAAGFRLGFHFDPIIYFPGWEAAYRSAVARLGAAVSPAAVAWISLGALRFLPPMRALLSQRFPESPIADGEMVLAPDGKLRYFKDLRIEMYARLREWLQEALPGTCLYLCMESPRVWQAVCGETPTGEDLSRVLDSRALSCCA
jgi:spore photoproduct lyase